MARSGNRVEVHIFVHSSPDPRLDQVLELLNTITQQEAQVATDLTQITASVQAETDVTQSAVTLLGQLSDLIKATATDPKALADLANQLDANKAALAAAITVNTPAAPPTPAGP